MTAPASLEAVRRRRARSERAPLTTSESVLHLACMAMFGVALAGAVFSSYASDRWYLRAAVAAVCVYGAADRTYRMATR